MKLYTEEQVKQIVEKSRETGLTAEYLMFVNTPIELPSDEEIFKESDDEDFITQQYAFVRGAKYVINKIKGGNK